MSQNRILESMCGGMLQLCSLCGQKFKNRHHLIVHMRCHDIVTFPCNNCDKTFTLTVTTMKTHFKTASSKNHHINDVHRLKVDNGYMIVKKSHEIPKILIQCHLCNKIFGKNTP